ALVEAYEADKAILDTYGESTILKRRREDDDQEGPFAGPNWGSKRQKEGEEPVQTTYQMEENPLPVYETGADDQPIMRTSQHIEWFSQPRRPPSPDRARNTALPAAQGDAQSWISELAKQADARSSFNELLDTPIDFSNFIMHRLNVDTLTLDLLAGATYELMRGSCSSLTELVYHLEEVYKATTNQLDWVNPEGQQYPHNLLQPLLLIPDNRGRRETPHPAFETGVDDQPIVQTSKHPEWFSQPRRPPSSDRTWNTTLPAAHGDAQSWISDLARQTDARSSFNELL
nr:hypothetical protein [Tanacetum cinerariifolium]